MRGHGTRLVLGILLVGILGLGCVNLNSQGAPDDAAIRATLNKQITAWNRGDIPAFMDTYENSPETTFIGKTLAKGFAPILERYKKAYSTREQMGTLTFSDLDVRLLPTSTGATEYAIVTGKYHLDRAAKDQATKDDGIFSLLWHKSGGHWKIMLDHTSS
jgi:ketosteroid isomerase-like protein